MDTSQGPHTKRGTLNNGNPAAPISRAWEAPRCSARRKSDGKPCRNPAVRGWTVCRMHGARGGPRTSEGLEACKRAPWKHGEYSAEAKEERRRLREMENVLKGMTSRMTAGESPRFRDLVALEEWHRGGEPLLGDAFWALAFGMFIPPEMVDETIQLLEEENEARGQPMDPWEEREWFYQLIREDGPER